MGTSDVEIHLTHGGNAIDTGFGSSFRRAIWHPILPNQFPRYNHGKSHYYLFLKWLKGAIKIAAADPAFSIFPPTPALITIKLAVHWDVGAGFSLRPDTGFSLRPDTGFSLRPDTHRGLKARSYGA